MDLPAGTSLRRLPWLLGAHWRVSRLRRVNPRPFGLTGDQGRPPLALGAESASAGLFEEVAAAVTKSTVSLDSLSIMYGDYFNLENPLVEVTTHWDGRGWVTPSKPSGVPSSTWGSIPPCAWDVGDAEFRDSVIARQDWRALGYPRRIPAEGPFSEGSAQIMVSGTPRTVPVAYYKRYTALSFEADDVIVTVVSRHPLPELPSFDPVTDLTAFFTGYTRLLEELADQR